MVTCPKCKAENRPEAAFCAQCGTILFSLTTLSKPVEQPAAAIPPESPSPSLAIEPTVILSGFTIRPEGSIFDNRFKYDSLVYQDEHEVHYTVTEIARQDMPSVRICSNPGCRTIHSPVGTEAEKFCTQCGQPLEQRSPLFLLRETDTNKYAAIQPIIDLHLVHPNIHPPITSFEQEMAGCIHYCLVTPYSQDLPAQPEIPDVLEWGIQLSQALDYLQEKGIAMGEALDQSSLGIAEGKAVWRNFSSARILPMLTDREKINNVRLLALALYSLMTGKTSYSLDPYLPQTLNDLFQKALVGEGFTRGAEFENQLNLVKSAELTRLNLDFQVGRRTHPGKVRKSNEDSLLCIELIRVHQTDIQPIGLVAIADGMGGHASGEQASNIVIDAIAQIGAFELVALQNPKYEDYSEWVKRAIQAANQALFEARQNVGNDMGSTLVLGLIVGSQAYLGHTGDSRIYLINKESIKQLTTDHSLVQHLLSTGKITPDEARFHPQRNVIYRSLGEKPEAEADYFTQQLFTKDRLLFCSDGLTSMLDDQKIQKIVLEASSPQAACNQLVKEVNAAGGEDNVSVIVVEVLSF